MCILTAVKKVILLLQCGLFAIYILCCVLVNLNTSILMRICNFLGYNHSMTSLK